MKTLELKPNELFMYCLKYVLLRLLHLYSIMNKINIFSSKCGGSSGSVLPWLGDNFDVELNMGYLGVSALLPHKSSPLQSY